jgi:hypothetical protein
LWLIKPIEIPFPCQNTVLSYPQCIFFQTTSGGTESLLLACKTYRDWAKEEKGIIKPEMQEFFKENTLSTSYLPKV